MPYQGRQYKTPPDYVPRHRIRDNWAGSTPRGPHRWARAAHNALVRPNSESARLYQKRVRLAVEYREFMDAFTATPEQPLIFMSWRGTRDYVVCSRYCAAMQAQLDRGARDLSDIIRALENRNDVRPDAPRTRDMRCQCCGSTVKRNAR